MSERRLLFLQGVASPFFDKLAKAFVSVGHQVYRINFCGGDSLYWASGNAWNYQGDIQQLDAYIEQKFEWYNFSDVVLFGDTRPVHRPAIRVARKFGAQILVFEEGYLRPHCITLEREGVNGNSLLPHDLKWYKKVGGCISRHKDPQPTGYSLLTRLFHDIAYNAARYAFNFRYPSYTLHRPQSPLKEYWGWAKRFILKGLFRSRHAKRVIDQVLDNKVHFFLFPLQLNYDSQVVKHSSFDNIQQALLAVIQSFARHAQADQHLIIKNHPLDIGTINFRKLIIELQRQYHLGQRVIYIDGGHLPTLLRHCKGTVTINSTVGISALHHQSPVYVLGDAIYNMPGLTFQGTLDDFWYNPAKPDAAAVANFTKVVNFYTQINGDFYSKTGIEMAVQGSVNRILFPEKVIIA